MSDHRLGWDLECGLYIRKGARAVNTDVARPVIHVPFRIRSRGNFGLLVGILDLNAANTKHLATLRPAKFFD